MNVSDEGAATAATCPAALVRALDAEFLDPDARYDAVLIENQPAVKNPMMKTVQVVLHTYFEVLKHYVSAVGEVRLVSATRKGRMTFAPPAVAPAGVNTEGGTTKPTAGAAYRERKAESVRTCTHYLRHVLCDDERLAQLTSSKKKDDLSDSLLQALWFAEERHRQAQAAATKLARKASRQRSRAG